MPVLGPHCQLMPCPLPQEFENADGEEYAAGRSAQGSPAAAVGGPDVYVLPLAEVSLPMAKQPGRSGEASGAGVGPGVLLYGGAAGPGAAWCAAVWELGCLTSGARPLGC